MTKISQFVQVRADGKLIPSTLTVKEMLALGWEPSKVIALRWNCDGNEAEIQEPNGIHGIVVPGSNFIAALYGEDATASRDRLIILSPDGSVHGKLENCVSIAGHEFTGIYSWFEPARTPRVDTFGVVFQMDEGGSLRCDVDARTPSLISTIRVH